MEPSEKEGSREMLNQWGRQKAVWGVTIVIAGKKQTGGKYR